MYISGKLDYKTSNDSTITDECPFECIVTEAEVDKDKIMIGTIYKEADVNGNIFKEHLNDFVLKMSNEQEQMHNSSRF